MPRLAHSSKYLSLCAAQAEHHNPGINVDDLAVPQLADMAAHCEADRTVKGMLLEHAKTVLKALFAYGGRVAQISFESLESKLTRHVRASVLKFLKDFVKDSKKDLNVAKQVFFDRKWAPKMDESDDHDKYMEVRRAALPLLSHPHARPCRTFVAGHRRACAGLPVHSVRRRDHRGLPCGW